MPYSLFQFTSCSRDPQPSDLNIACRQEQIRDWATVRLKRPPESVRKVNLATEPEFPDFRAVSILSFGRLMFKRTKSGCSSLTLRRTSNPSEAKSAMWTLE